MNDSSTTNQELTRWLERAFFEAMEEHRPGLAALVRGHLARRAPQVGHLIHNPLDEMNVAYTLLAVAGFDALAPIEGETAAQHAIDTALHAPVKPRILEETTAMLDSAADPFSAMVAASREREQSYFGSSFEFHRPIDDGYGYVLEVRRCLYHQVLLACERPQLMPLLCRADTAWIDAINPGRHRLRFVRPSTFATSSTCRMWFMRTDGDNVTAEAIRGS